MGDSGDRGPTLTQKLGAELFGTFFATLIPIVIDIQYFSGAAVDDVSRWLARGFATSALIYAFSETSGAHINPAVSLAFVARRAMPWTSGLAYIVTQFAAAFIATGIALLLWPHRLALGASHPGQGYSLMTACGTEAIATLLLMAVILGCAEEEARIGKQSALAVGLCVAVLGFVAGPISGASMNPARSVAPQLLSGMGSLSIIYIAGPALGALIAVAVVNGIFGPAGSSARKAAQGR